MSSTLGQSKPYFRQSGDAMSSKSYPVEFKTEAVKQDTEHSYPASKETGRIGVLHHIFYARGKQYGLPMEASSHDKVSVGRYSHAWERTWRPIPTNAGLAPATQIGRDHPFRSGNPIH